jgi:hypothetical protein
MNILEDTYTRVADWLKYAEAKNAVLVAFDSTISLAIAGFLSNKMEIAFIPDWYLKLSLVLFVGGAAISLISFLPQIAQFEFKKKQHHNLINPLYFADIAKLTEDEYAKIIQERYNLDKEFTLYEKDLINQITYNSKIAVIKFRNFSIALWLNIAVFLTPLIILIPMITKLRGQNGRSKSSSNQI